MEPVSLKDSQTIAGAPVFGFNGAIWGISLGLSLVEKYLKGTAKEGSGDKQSKCEVERMRTELELR